MKTLLSSKSQRHIFELEHSSQYTIKSMFKDKGDPYWNEYLWNASALRLLSPVSLAVVTLQTFYRGKFDLLTVYLGKLDFIF